ncbi:MaoC family dehydratase [Nocardioides sp. Arc9.136]|uniref:MaoC family dehydratase n=1 Tax=Nocardioides sp. Arc9.136 TaxID=2996826 RepID=UPI002665CE7A|nr:MaoC family dehydratase [Nocardioides sp. Arc9.136]WKN48448.1 MaoC family dehydratase [Nocardioides sp. Arc9.136]
MTRTFHGVEELRAGAGVDLPPGPWFTVTQERIDAFADVTEDWQWIHVDPERAAASPTGSTIAHGYLTLSLLPRLSSDLFDFAGIGRAVNYGLDRVRFPAVVRPGDRVRARGHLVEVTDSGTGVLARVRYSIEVKGLDRPACVAEALMLVEP